MATTCFKAGEAVSTGDVIFLSSAGFLYKASSLTLLQASAVGIALDTGASGSLIRVNPDSLYTNASGLTPGETRYLALSASGTTTTYSAWSDEFILTTYSGAYLTKLGTAVSTSGLSVEISKPLFVNNDVAVFALESSSGVAINPLLLENSSILNLESSI